MVSKLFLGAVAGATVAIGYCVYFDQKRRSDPNFHQKLRDRRAKAQRAANQGAGMPDPSDAEAVQRYFMVQLQRGEACLMNGMVEESVQHFCNAVRASGSPTQILRILAESLPPQVFSMIVKRLSEDPNCPPSLRPGSRGSAPTTATVGVPVFDMDRRDSLPRTGPTVTLVDDELE